MPREEFSQAHWQIVLSRGGGNLALAAKAATCYDVQGETWEFWERREAWVQPVHLLGQPVTLILADAFKHTAACLWTQHKGLSCPVWTSSLPDVGLWNDPEKLNPKTSWD